MFHATRLPRGSERVSTRALSVVISGHAGQGARPRLPRQVQAGRADLLRAEHDIAGVVTGNGGMLRLDIFTLFPEMFNSPFDASIIHRAREAGQVVLAVHNIRDYATDRHHMTDDTPYGGGGGMVMKPEPIWNAVEAVLGFDPAGRSDVPPIILLTPQGRPFTQAVARELASQERLLLICGRYEGVDERVRQQLASDEISIGDYVLTGGEVPAMVIVDTVVRLLPGVLGDPGATADDSHASGLLEYPHYTRPAVYRGYAVPEVLLSGHHAEVERWRRRESLRRTYQRRPDLLAHADLSPAEREFLAQLEAEDEQGAPQT